jgi:long-chain acyl-CoA synthetase
LINDCKPSVIIASDAIQLKKINTIIKKHSFIKKVISFENIKDKNVTFIEEIFNKTYKQEKNFKEIGLRAEKIFHV